MVIENFQEHHDRKMFFAGLKAYICERAEQEYFCGMVNAAKIYIETKTFSSLKATAFLAFLVKQFGITEAHISFAKLLPQSNKKQAHSACTQKTDRSADDILDQFKLASAAGKIDFFQARDLAILLTEYYPQTTLSCF